ncbi:MAG: carboxypeptidase-like regulatory domain-containing protein [Alistipes sp.]|jgi:hypothetical protein|nr:carboxypeptidase-like regulatory domain-containing protein [Alistipes sp.]
MKTSKILASALVVLGFGGAVGAATGCAPRAQKSRAVASAPDEGASTSESGEGDLRFGADTTMMRVMYGVPNVPFLPRPEIVEPEAEAEAEAETGADTAPESEPESESEPEPLVAPHAGLAPKPEQESRSVVSGTITGTVVDEKTGDPVIAARVIKRGATEAAVLTDYNGEYSIEAIIGDTLEFRYLGYKANVVEIKADTLNIVMEADYIKDYIKPVVTMYGPPRAIRRQLREERRKERKASDDI